jgi:uncharacterized membrane protein
MPHCTKCGAMLAENAGFCGNCGAAQGVAAPPQPTGNPGTAWPGADSGMAENVAALLSYVLGWITGLIFFLIDKRPYVRFHAAQSIVVFGGLHLVSILLGIFFGFSMLGGGWTGFSIGFALFRLIHLVVLILWVLLMIKAYQGERFRVPVAADFADKMAGK